MPKKDTVPRADLEFCALLTHIVGTLPEYYVTLGITALSPKVAQLLKDAAAFVFLCARQHTLVQAGQGATRERDRAREGDPENPDNPVSYAYPEAPDTADTPETVLPGIEKRLRDFIKWLRGLDGYTEAIGEALHLVGEESAPVDPSTLQPVLSLRTSGGHVEVRWGWEDAAHYAQALHMEVDRGAGSLYLATDTTPDYTDTTPMPAEPQKWRYRGMWMRDGVMVGQWSLWVEITVGG